MAITDKEQGVWIVDQVYNKINEGGIWQYSSDQSQLMGWGRNITGSLGLNNLTSLSSPTQLPGTTWSHTGLFRGHGNEGGYNNGLIRTDGTLWVMGENGEGHLGLNDLVGHSSPIQVGTDATWSHGCQLNDAMAAIKTTGSLWTWGANSYGQLGHGQWGGPPNRYRKSSPTQLPGSDWSKIGSGSAFMGAIKTDGTLWTWGANVNGKLGRNQASWPGSKSSPNQVPGTNWAQLACGQTHVNAVKVDGTMWGWGQGHHGVLGNNLGYPSPSYEFSSPIQCGTDTNWSTSDDTLLQAALVAGSVKTDGTLWMWGHNGQGVLGQNQAHAQLGDASSPMQIGTGTNWRSIHRAGQQGPGAAGVVATKTDNTAWFWGYGQAGASGLNSNIRYSSPVQIPGSWLGYAGGGGAIHMFKML